MATRKGCGLLLLAALALAPVERAAQTTKPDGGARPPQSVLRRTAYPPDPGEIEFLEWYCFEEVNRRRKQQLLPPLELSQELIAVARAYSRRMAEEDFFSHTDPEGHTVNNRARDAGIKKWQIIGENLMKITGFISPVPPAVDSWMESEVHRQNILNPEFKYAAVGAWVGRSGTVYFTEVFINF
jgi:uncharacterized protein YkwD